MKLKPNEEKALLHSSIESQNTEIFKYLLGNERPILFSIEEKNKQIDRAFLHASAAGNLEAVKTLIDHDANYYVKNKDGMNALDIAASLGKKDIVQYFLEKKYFGNESINMALLYTAVSGNTEIFQMLLDHGANIFIKNNEQLNILHIASKHGHYEFLNHVLDKRSSIKDYINNPDVRGNTPLHYSASSGDIRIFQMLLDNGANLKLTNSQGTNPLHIAAIIDHKAIVEYLLEEGKIQPNETDNAGNTPLHYAASSGATNSAKFLLLYGAKISIRNNDGNTPKQIAEQGKYTEVADLIQNRSKHIKKESEHLLKLVCREDTKSVTKHLKLPTININIQNKEGQTPLHLATVDENLKLMEILLKNKNINAATTDNDDETALHYAMSCESIKPLKTLLQYKNIGINKKNKDGNTALNCINQDTKSLTERIKALLDYQNIDVNAANNLGLTPLHTVAIIGNLEAAKMLVAKGAKIDAKTIHMKSTPLQIAEKHQHNEVVSFLISNKEFHINVANNDFEKTADSLKSKKVIINSRLENGQTALHTAIENNNERIIDLLLRQNGINVNIQDNQRNTPIHLAILNGSEEILQKLLKKKGNVNIQGSDGYSPLHIAISESKPNLVKTLLNNGANQDLKTDLGKTALSLCDEMKEGSQKEEISKLLLKNKEES